ncbi:hypothetical protein C7212DRAFT_346364 [Tuber magnatum]|uniref:Anaphase-promoting complex subunit 4-like WD40 domain-containing protein n=1 Tax=Tuber magnatum TaxID=42249 RepID=A0A317SIT3_9PEZI|nr:hypothetical protein C7212DRAFT_346364 [Tuber magnatum]
MHGHEEGYAVDWPSNPRDVMGRIATGDNSGKIFITTRKEGGSIEELQWPPNERHVFASASSDGKVKVYDARTQIKQHHLSIEVSSSNAGVESWCRAVPHLLVTGADDRVWGIWDLRTFPNTCKDSTITFWDLSLELGGGGSKDPGGVEDIPPKLLPVHYHKVAREVH